MAQKQEAGLPARRRGGWAGLHLCRRSIMAGKALRGVAPDPERIQFGRGVQRVNEGMQIRGIGADLGLFVP